MNSTFQSTHSLRSATRLRCPARSANPVSIHALLAECDQAVLAHGSFHPEFQSTHSLRSATITDGDADCENMSFQSTHSLRSATVWGGGNGNPVFCFNPRTPCGVRHYQRRRQGCSCGFNPRTPCGVRQKGNKTMSNQINLFQSTHSLRSATDVADIYTFLQTVSIHALLAECDGRLSYNCPCPACFNPRTPCGVRLEELRSRSPESKVSIHALLAECDRPTISNQQ